MTLLANDFGFVASLVLMVAGLILPRRAAATSVVIAEGGTPHCTIIVPDHPAFIEQRAASELVRVIARDAGAVVQVKPFSQLASVPPEHLVLLLGTPASAPIIGKLANDLPDGIGDLPLLGPDGYAVQALQQDGRGYLVIAGASPRAVYYAAVYAGEQVLVPPPPLSPAPPAAVIPPARPTPASIPALAVTAPPASARTAAPAQAASVHAPATAPTTPGASAAKSNSPKHGAAGPNAELLGTAAPDTVAAAGPAIPATKPAATTPDLTSPAAGLASPTPARVDALMVDDNVKISRAPALAERAPYTLGFTGIQPEYTLNDWKVVLDGMAREGINRVYFWWQSLYKPTAFPDRRGVDGGNARIKMTNADVNELAAYAHQLGMKFLLGGGAFSWGGASALTDVYPETAAKGVGGMCPSNPKAREIQAAFTMEMLKTIPKADGIWFEPRDEHGECKCDICQKPVDSLGSKQYGQSEISWLKDFSKRLWAQRPDAEISWLVELYKPSKMHSEDPAYFAKIAQIKDPRIHWIVVWGAWDFPGPDGKYRPNTFFSRQNVWWNKPYVMSLEDLQAETLRVADMGLLGYSPAFEMCFSVDYYGGSIPYPMDLLPYELTSYAFREFSWEPSQTVDQFKAKMLRRYFGPGASPELVDDLVYLRQFAIAGGWATNRSVMLTSMAGEFVSWDGKPAARQDPAAILKTVPTYSPADRKVALDRLERRLKDLYKIQTEDLPRMVAMETRMHELERSSNLRTRASFILMRRFITDTRHLVDKIGLTPAQIDQMLKQTAALRSAAT